MQIIEAELLDRTNRPFEIVASPGQRGYSRRFANLADALRQKAEWDGLQSGNLSRLHVSGDYTQGFVAPGLTRPRRTC